MSEGASVAVTAFRLFHKFASTVETSTADIAKLADPVERRVGERLVQLAPLDRQALLLVHQRGWGEIFAGLRPQRSFSSTSQRLANASRGMGKPQAPAQPRAC